MSDIGPGDWVECIRVNYPGNGFAAGAVYCVEAVTPGKIHCLVCNDNCVGLRLVNMPTPHQAGFHPGVWLNWWTGCAFRPIWRRKKSLIDTLLEPIPEVEAQTPQPDPIPAETKKVEQT